MHKEGIAGKFEGGHREVDGQELKEFEPRFGDSIRECGFTWTHGRTA
jgi:hypothetical protein